MIDDSMNAEDKETASWLKDQFESVHYNRSAPIKNEQGESERKAKSYALRFSFAASLLAVFGLVFQFLGGPSEPVWANEPTDASALETSAIREVCENRLATGLGELQESGSSTLSESNSLSSTDLGLNPPSKLPPTAVIDIRNTGALGIFEDKNWRIICLVKFDGSTWKDQGLNTLGLDAGQDNGLTFSGTTSWVNGSAVSYLSGSLPAGKACATFTLLSGEKVLASCNAGKFAVWYPSTLELDNKSLSFF